MTTASRSAFLALLRSNSDALDQSFQAIADKLRALLLKAADADGKIPLDAWQQLERQVAAYILYFFMSQDGTAYTLAHNGTLVAKSPFAKLLWSAVEQATRQAVAEQADALKASLPADTVTALQHATQNPFLAYDLIAADDGQDWFSQYLPPYGDVFGDGKTLEDRIHSAAGATRQKVLALLRDELSTQRKAADIADTLDTFLTGTLDRRNTKYGTTARFDSARLLAGQTTYASQHARLLAAVLNPSIETVSVVLSPSHKEVDECDAVAGGSPYALKDAPILPIHGNCLCQYVFHTTRADLTSSQALNLLKLQGALSPNFADLLLRGGRS